MTSTSRSIDDARLYNLMHHPSTDDICRGDDLTSLAPTEGYLNNLNSLIKVREELSEDSIGCEAGQISEGPNGRVKRYVSLPSAHTYSQVY